MMEYVLGFELLINGQCDWIVGVRHSSRDICRNICVRVFFVVRLFVCIGIIN